MLFCPIRLFVMPMRVPSHHSPFGKLFGRDVTEQG
jgi:hypothetical protein